MKIARQSAAPKATYEHYSGDYCAANWSSVWPSVASLFPGAGRPYQKTCVLVGGHPARVIFVRKVPYKIISSILKVLSEYHRFPKSLSVSFDSGEDDGPMDSFLKLV